MVYNGASFPSIHIGPFECNGVLIKYHVSNWKRKKGIKICKKLKASNSFTREITKELISRKKIW